jgi:hypothetical protein
MHIIIIVVVVVVVRVTVIVQLAGFYASCPVAVTLTVQKFPEGLSGLRFPNGWYFRVKCASLSDCLTV